MLPLNVEDEAEFVICEVPPINVKSARVFSVVPKFIGVADVDVDTVLEPKSIVLIFELLELIEPFVRL